MLPLPVFLVYVRVIDPAVSSDWLGPYLSASLVAIAVTSVLVIWRLPLNPIFIGIDMYFYVGSAGLLFGWGTFNRWVGELQAAGMLLFVAVVGLCLSFFAPRGFVGVKSKASQRYWSLVLVLLAALCAGVSYFWVGNVWLSEVLPFVALFSVAGVLRARLLTQEGDGSPSRDERI